MFSFYIYKQHANHWLLLAEFIILSNKTVAQEIGMQLLYFEYFSVVINTFFNVLYTNLTYEMYVCEQKER